MKIIKKIFLGLILFIVLALVGFWLYTLTLHPDYDGELELANLQEEVTVYFDNIGVPHIQAQNQEDAYRALGYVHAQDRLWQMELIRRIAPGRLSEVFGENPAVQEADVFFSGLGITENTEKTLQQINKNSESYLYASAYIDGINQFIDDGFTPIEYTLVGLEKEKFTLKDMYNVFGYMSFSFATAHKIDPFLTEIKEKLGNEYLTELGIPINSTTLIKNEKNDVLKGELSSIMNRLYESVPVSPFIGSNAWVIAPKKTKNGKVLFANDPHIGFSQPSVWYQSHIKTPDYEMYGYNLALTPFPLLGHNRKYAYGLTMFENDDVDFFFEKDNPSNKNQYLTPDGYKNYDIKDKTIKIKNSTDSIYQIRESKHGPIINDIIPGIEEERPMAMWWAYTQFPNKILDVTYRLSHANNLSEFKEGASWLHAPGLNIMYGDSYDNIAWFASGQLYQYRDSLNTKLVLDGASGKDEIRTILPFKKNPQAINPSWNYVYSANNQTDSIDGDYYPGYYVPEDRAKRITTLLESRNDWTKEDVMGMINDKQSSVASIIVGNILDELDTSNFSELEQSAYQILRDWDGNYQQNLIEPTLYNRLIYEFLVATFKDEMKKGFEGFLNTHLQKKMLGIQIAKESSIWWDDVNTDRIETKKDIMERAFKNSIRFLTQQLGENIDEWNWGSVISVEHKHAMGEVSLLRSTFNVGPFTVDSGEEVIDNHIFKLDSTGYYKVYAGPSARRVIDFSDVENSVSILPTGQSGNIFSPHYKDQASKYVNGEFVKMVLNPKEIEGSKNKLVFKKK